MSSPENPPPHPSAHACPRCGAAIANSFGDAGGVCLRCAGERAFALGSNAPFESVAPGPSDDAPAAILDSDLPVRIGPYEIIEELGRGGMGRVFAARQRGLGRIVALKVLPLGPGAPPELEMRFLREAQTVARLRHPHIVAIHDSGRAAGHVYFSMDYIEGGDLARRLRERTFTPRESAALVAKVADALAQAHAEGVLHRDLKPSNILLDGDEPRLADFGLAAQLESSGDLTGASGVFGTPHYLAPEAQRGGGAALSAASDLYALGVVLYAMLAGRTPFAGASPAELLALSGDHDPPALHLLAPAVPRDLETICLKCLERDPAQRYATAAALAEDLRRWLAGEPIAARPPGRLERFRRFARRHRAALLVATGVTALLIAATIVSTSLAVRARRAEKRAATEAAVSRAVSEFLQNDLLAQASPDQQPDRDLKLRTVLDRAAKKIDGRFPDQPLVEAALRETLALTYASLGEHASEQHHVERALALRRQQLGPDDPATLRLMEELVGSLAEQGKIKEAAPLGETTLALMRRVLGPEHPQTLHTMNDLIYVTKAQGRLADAETLAVETLALARRALGPTHEETRNAMINLASIYFAERKLPEAESLNAEAVAAQIKALGPDHPDTLVAMSNLASVYWAGGKLADSERMGLELLAIRRRVLGPDHPETLRTMNNLATTYTEEGKLAEAAALHEQTLAIRQRTLGAEHPDTLSTTINLAAVRITQGQLEIAEALLTPALATCQRLFGPSHPHTMTALYNLADLRRQQGRLGDAETLDTQALDARLRTSGPDNSQTLQVQEALAGIFLQEKKSAEAEALLRRAVASREKTAPDNWRTHATRSQLGEALAALDRRAEAESLLLAAEENLAQQSDKIPPRFRGVRRDARSRLVQLYAVWAKPAEAEAWRQKLAALQTP